jgi:hypothetical protein
MRNAMSKVLIAGLATVSLMASVIATADSAAAGYWHGGGWHGGGWHGGWHRGWYGGAGWWGPAVVGELAAGALLAAPYYGDSCYSSRPTYDGYGNYLGQQLVNICQ